MEALVIIVVLIAVVALFNFAGDRLKGFTDPSGMSDQEILSAIAGQADWLEKQLHHVAKFGGSEPHPEMAERRRHYIASLCEALVSRHPEPINVLYSATKRASQLEAEGTPRAVAVVQGVKQRLFADNGYTYMARWHSTAQ